MLRVALFIIDRTKLRKVLMSVKKHRLILTQIKKMHATSMNFQKKIFILHRKVFTKVYLLYDITKMKFEKNQNYCMVKIRIVGAV
jgi:hypothetical protein